MAHTFPFWCPYVLVGFSPLNLRYGDFSSRAMSILRSASQSQNVKMLISRDSHARYVGEVCSNEGVVERESFLHNNIKVVLLKLNYKI